MNEHETVADIIAEKRREANYIVQVSQGKCQTRRDKAEDEARDIRREADRLEAANKREHGDCAKLREAMKHIKDRLPHMLQYMRVHWEDASSGGYFDELMLVIDVALAAPPRNCDRYATAKEAHQAWLYDAGNWDEFGSPKLELHDWLFAPATEKEGESNEQK